MCGTQSHVAEAENLLILLLPRKERLQLKAACKPVGFDPAQVLYEPGDRARYAYFPVQGFVSVLAMINGSPGVEVGMVGREGMLGVHLALGVRETPLKALVQGRVTAWRIEAQAFKSQLAQSPSLQRVVNQYVYVLMTQLASAVACQRFHQISGRLARWLLMSQDRACSNCFCITQEFLACVLGVRRVSITTAAGALRQRSLIDYRRGELTVLDRAGLEAAACGCYESDRQAYSHQLR